MGRSYTIFDTAIGRCGIAWSEVGVVGIQLPEAREIETRGRLFRQFPEARDLRPSANIEAAIAGIADMLRGRDVDFSDIEIDWSGISPFNRRVYDHLRSIPRGETRSPLEISAYLQAPGALHAVAQALGKNPLPLIVPCHRALDPGNGLDKISPNCGTISKRRLLSLEGSQTHAGFSLFDVLLTVDRPRAS